MKTLLVGLGNPGERFAGTRHNLGADVLKYWEDHVLSDDSKGVKLVYPTDYFMNDTGKLVGALVQKNGYSPGDIVLLHDDLELAYGKVAASPGGSARGHNGVRSVLEALSTLDVPRIRLGIGRPPEHVEPHDFVLARFGVEERATFQELLAEGADALTTYLRQRQEE